MGTSMCMVSHFRFPPNGIPFKFVLAATAQLVDGTTAADMVDLSRSVAAKAGLHMQKLLDVLCLIILDCADSCDT